MNIIAEKTHRMGTIVVNTFLVPLFALGLEVEFPEVPVEVLPLPEDEDAVELLVVLRGNVM